MTTRVFCIRIVPCAHLPFRRVPRCPHTSARHPPRRACAVWGQRQACMSSAPGHAPCPMTTKPSCSESGITVTQRQLRAFYISALLFLYYLWPGVAKLLTRFL
ncbi:hypothetical protein BDR03DRAFT_940717 [Suillus americanus]|nr:hypothetical protein BDR03DRAFT_940717 [Suillus americanus]